MALSAPPTNTPQYNQVRPGSKPASTPSSLPSPFGTPYIPNGQPVGQTILPTPPAPAAPTPAPAPTTSKTKTGPGPEVPGANVSPGSGNSAADAASKFQQAMPGYIANQVNSAQDQARVALANDIQGAKAKANASGLLYSGLEPGAESTAAATEGSNLASNIQGINAGALSQLATLQNNAVTQAQIEGQSGTQMAALQAQASQTAYEQALQEQQAQNSYYEGLLGTAGSLLGRGIGLAAGA